MERQRERVRVAKTVHHDQPNERRDRQIGNEGMGHVEA